MTNVAYPISERGCESCGSLNIGVTGVGANYCFECYESQFCCDFTAYGEPARCVCTSINRKVSP